MSIRPARPDEALAVTALVRAAYAPWVPRIGREPLPMADDYAARIAAGQVWVLEVAGTIQGIVVLEDRSDGLLLDNIAVATKGAGHGRALLAFADAEARRRGHRKVRLYTNARMTENIALYRRLGFVETGRAHEHGLDRVYMEQMVA
jgi:GNAT superfamily N-acetyltransferase